LDKCIIIAAAGRGERMNLEIPKQFVLLAGKPVLMHTLEVFNKIFHNIHIILVLPADMFDTWKELCNEYHYHVSHDLVQGGPSRFYSVRNALQTVNEGVLVGIHDGVRPLVNRETVIRAFQTAEAFGHAIPAIPFNESVRILDKDSNHHVNRDLLRIIQTPQVFHSGLIKKAYNQDYRDDFTDDASVLETLGINIRLVEGDSENIKITTRQDLFRAEALLLFRSS
jgi:2-C-methyl-D-erythritol 4-phosphate cytidylyltransferase